MDTGKGKYADLIAKNRPDLTIYKNCDGILQYRNHLNLNLSTAEYVAKKLNDLGGFNFHKDATHHEKDYVLAIMRNGDGKTVFIRGMIQSSHSDREQEPGTGICEHDTAALLAAIHTLVSAKGHWRGNLVVLFQPNELNAEELEGITNTTQAALIKRKRIIPDFIFAHRFCVLGTGLVAIQEGRAINFFDKAEVTTSVSPDPGTQLNESHIGSWITTIIREGIKRSLPLDTPPTISSVNCSLDGDKLTLRFGIRTPHTRIGVHRDVLDLIEHCIHWEYRVDSMATKSTLEGTMIYPPATGPFHQAFSEHFGIDLGYGEFISYPEFLNVWQRAFPAAYAYWHIDGPTPENNTAQKVQSSLKTGADAMALAVLSVLGHDN